MGKKSSPRKKDSFFDDPLPLTLSLTLTLLPLVMFPIGTDIYALPKVTFLYLASLLLVFLYFARAAKAEEFALYRSIFDLPVLLILVYTAISLFLSESPLLGLVGRHTRYESLPALICYAAIYFVSVQSIRNEDGFERILKVMVLGFIPVAMYGLAQSAGFDFPDIPRFGPSVYSSLGNPILLGAYLVIVLPILFSLAKNSREANWKLLIWTLIPVGIVILLLTESRGSWLGLVASMVAVFIIRRSPGMALINKKPVVIAIMAIVLIAVSLMFYVDSNFLGQRLLSALIPPEDSAVIRLETWKASLEMISDRPLLGFGLEQMGYWFPTYKTLEHTKIAPGMLADHARNDFLQVAVSVGIPGLLLYAWLFTLALLGIFRGRAKSPYSTGLFAAITGYFMQAQVGISAVFITPIVWSLLGASARLTFPVRKVTIVSPQWFRSQTAISVIGAVFMMSALLSLKPVIADFHIYKGHQISASSPEQSVTEFEQAISTYPYQTAYLREASDFYINYAAHTQSSIYAQRAASISKQGLMLNRRDFELAYYAGEASFLNYRLTENEMSLAKSQDYFELAEDLWPSLSVVKSRLLEVAILRGETRRAVKKAEEMIKMGVEDPRAYDLLATEAQKNGDLEKAERYFRRLAELESGPLQSTKQH